MGAQGPARAPVPGTAPPGVRHRYPGPTWGPDTMFSTPVEQIVLLEPNIDPFCYLLSACAFGHVENTHSLFVSWCRLPSDSSDERSQRGAGDRVAARARRHPQPEGESRLTEYIMIHGSVCPGGRGVVVRTQCLLICSDLTHDAAV